MEEVDELQGLIRYLSPSVFAVQMLRYSGGFAMRVLLVCKRVSVLLFSLFRALLEGERMALQDANRRMTQQPRERVIGTILQSKSTV